MQARNQACTHTRTHTTREVSTKVSNLFVESLYIWKSYANQPTSDTHQPTSYKANQQPGQRRNYKAWATNLTRAWAINQPIRNTNQPTSDTNQPTSYRANQQPGQPRNYKRKHNCHLFYWIGNEKWTWVSFLVRIPPAAQLRTMYPYRPVAWQSLGQRTMCRCDTNQAIRPHKPSNQRHKLLKQQNLTNQQPHNPIMLMMMSGEDEKDEQGRGKEGEAQNVLREKPNNPNLKDGELLFSSPLPLPQQPVLSSFIGS
jgi:hypothetical protein